MAEEKEVKEEEGEKLGMKPWEQHSGVISIPRFDYNAPASLLHHSHSGFLVTCPIKREKSATKEAISILEKFVGLFNIGSSESLKSSDANVVAKRRKICMGEVDGECPTSIESKDAAASSVDSSGKLLEDSCMSSTKSNTNVERSPTFSLVKLTRSGLLLFTALENDSPDLVDVVSKIFCSLESGSLSSPLWCHRIFPIQATCCLNEKELHATVSKLVIQFVNDKRNKLAQPIKFAVGYNRRGMEETEMKISRNSSKDSKPLALLDRNKCFSIVAAALKDVVSDSVVDLKSPELSVLVEMLPLSGLPNGSLVVAVSVLPCNLITTKPRLCIRPLVSDTKARKGPKNR
ncbi:Checkpoint protein like [Actinidia chinensis var. chinensis]|uniref:Checkpoint protein like n=1 Tax=Actinidia chinensis var. chinensis TaxID=1590841 RepID=A0A2R6P3P4_ACTCC|nr:Checkpoint protein like [Actinidia chinensis var. chinensis]